MRSFIKIDDNIVDAEREKRILTGRHKPKPYKEWRELTFDERVYSKLRSHYIIQFQRSDLEESRKLQRVNMNNHACQKFPALAKKLGLKPVEKHE